MCEEIPREFYITHENAKEHGYKGQGLSADTGEANGDQQESPEGGER